MAYLALYREWRPKTFKDMVGQEHVTKTLVNALKQEKIAHAYLFSGPRGTGKTTAAKVLAKALNCEQREGVEPCNHCPSCRSIDQGSAMEVFEIDAASNRGIDEIRDLRENVKLSAVQGKYKVYIIDEVHMLTTEAFNALLKTLEEPPQRVVFILATTEVQKIPLTILSRVQRFEFHRITVEDIKNRLSEVCVALNRQVDPSALLVIAQKSEGGLRDALSILDQCLLQDDPLGMEEVYQVLGMVGEDFSAQLVKAILASDYGQALTFLTEGIQQGRDPRQIIRELLDYLRQMLLSAATGQPPLVAPHIQAQLVKQSEQAGISRLLRWISILLQGESQLKYASNARLAAELLLVQTIHETQHNANGTSDEIIKRLDEMEQQIQNAQFSRERISNGGRVGKERVPAPPVPDENTTVLAANIKTLNAQMKNVENSGQAKEGKPNDFNLEEIQERWNDVLEQVKKRKKSTQAFLMEGKPVQWDGSTLTVLFREGFSFHRDKVNQNENRQTVEDVLKQCFGVSMTLQNVLESEFKNKALPEDTETQKQEQVLIDKAIDLFGRDLVVIKEE